MHWNNKQTIYFSLTLCVIFLFLGLIGLSYHEVWRDELQIWTLANESRTLRDFQNNLTAELHPAIWSILAFLITRLTPDFFYLQILNLLFGTASVYLITKYAPFTKLQKILLCFSYFVFYEYSIIVRCYALEILIIFLLCILYQNRRHNYLKLAVIMFLLSNTVIYGTIIAATYGLMIIFEKIFYQSASNNKIDWKAYLSLFIFLAGIIIGFGDVLLQTLRWGYFSSGMPNTEAVKDFHWFVKNISVISHAYIPIPNIESAHSWNSNILMALPVDYKIALGIILSFSLYLASFLIFARKPMLLAFYFLATLIMWILIAFIYHGQLRHHGHIFIVFITCYWLSFYIKETDWLIAAKKKSIFRLGKFLNAFSMAVSNRSSAIFTILLILQVFAGICAYSIDIKNTFSNAGQTARYLSNEKFANMTIMGSMDYAMQPITYFLNKKIYYPEIQKFGTYTEWSKERYAFTHSNEALKVLIAKGVDFLQKDKENILIIVSHHPWDKQPVNFNGTIFKNVGQTILVAPSIKLKLIQNIDGANVVDENYYIFLLCKYSDLL